MAMTTMYRLFDDEPYTLCVRGMILPMVYPGLAYQAKAVSTGNYTYQGRVLVTNMFEVQINPTERETLQSLLFHQPAVAPAVAREIIEVHEPDDADPAATSFTVSVSVAPRGNQTVWTVTRLA